MVKEKYLSFLSLISAIIGFIFSLSFQSMAYMGEEGELTMGWFWIGGMLSYFFLIVSGWLVILLKKTNKKLTIVDSVFKVFSIILIIVAGFLTTFISIAWQSGF